MYTDYTAKNVERFWSKVDLSKADDDFACWEWTGAHSQGYGTIGWQGRHSYLAHRLAYELTFGEFPADMCVCHHCDNPACCNPNHLFIGTRVDNNLDREQKGRNVSLSGESNGFSKLSEMQVAEIRQRYDAAKGKRGIQRALAREFGVDHAQIWRIVHNKQWRTPPPSA